MVVGLMKRGNIIFTAYKPLIWRGLLWHTGKVLPGRKIPYTRTPFKVESVFVENNELSQVASIEAMSSDTIVGARSGVWIQIDNYLYVRLRSETESGAYCSAQDWMFNMKVFGYNVYYTSEQFNVVDGAPLKHALVSKHSIKTSAELDDFSKIKFNTLKVDLLRKYFDAEDLQGKRISFYDNKIQTKYETQFVENVSFDENIISLQCKDIRAALADFVIDQKYDKNKYQNADNRIVIDKDTAQKYMADAIGYCASVPGDCLNGYAHDSMPYRKFRFAYGKIEVDYYYEDERPDKNKGVEVEVENGWRVMQKGSPGGENVWWEEEVQETLPGGTNITTTLICVPNRVVHPPENGFIDPDYERTPRKLRVTGTFHAEIPNITRPYTVFEYLMRRYSSQVYDANSFNVGEIKEELSLLENAPIGVYFDKPLALYNAIAVLQNGCVYGWQLYQERGRITARVNNPDRTPWGKIAHTDIINIKSLKPGSDGLNYITDAVIGYAKNYSEGVSSEYTDAVLREQILDTRIIAKTNTVETLLKNQEDAAARYGEAIAYSRKISFSVQGVLLRPPAADPQKFFSLRIYDFVEIDFGNLISSKTGLWIITNIEIDTDANVTKISVKEKV
jgi:hypothetical protein